MMSFLGGSRWTGFLGSKFLGSGTWPEDIVAVVRWGIDGGFVLDGVVVRCEARVIPVAAKCCVRSW